MKRRMSYKKEISFKNNINEIESISLDCNYEEQDLFATGEFIVSGSYKTSFEDEIEEFSYTLPFEESIDNIIEDSLEIEISDFTYEIDGKKLIIFIDYILKYEEKKDTYDEEEFRTFLSEHEVDVINLNKEKNIPEKKVEENNSDIEEQVIEENKEDERLSIENTIINNISQDERYITYSIHIVNDKETIEDISKQYNISIEEIKSFNDIDDVKFGMKIILPIKDE